MAGVVRSILVFLLFAWSYAMVTRHESGYVIHCGKKEISSLLRMTGAQEVKKRNSISVAPHTWKLCGCLWTLRLFQLNYKLVWSYATDPCHEAGYVIHWDSLRYLVGYRFRFGEEVNQYINLGNFVKHQRWILKWVIFDRNTIAIYFTNGTTSSRQWRGQWSNWATGQLLLVGRAILAKVPSSFRRSM